MNTLYDAEYYNFRAQEIITGVYTTLLGEPVANQEFYKTTVQDLEAASGFLDVSKDKIRLYRNGVKDTEVQSELSQIEDLCRQHGVLRKYGMNVLDMVKEVIKKSN